jgi:hypothetical protein
MHRTTAVLFILLIITVIICGVKIALIAGSILFGVYLFNPFSDALEKPTLIENIDYVVDDVVADISSIGKSNRNKNPSSVDDSNDASDDDCRDDFSDYKYKIVSDKTKPVYSHDRVYDTNDMLDGNERLVNLVRTKNDPIRQVKLYRKGMDKMASSYLREELDEAEYRDWWGRSEM